MNAIILKHSFLKFIIVGVINTLVGSALIFLLYNVAGAGYWFSSGIGFFLSSILSFFLNKHFTFNVNGLNLPMVAIFIVNIVICYGLSYGIAKPAVNYLLRNYSIKTRENIALFTGICLFTGLNYLGQRFVVFRKRGVVI